jgi:hypothetical protein
MSTPATPLRCQHALQHVTVYARGATVTRRVLLPADLPLDEITLSIAPVTPRLLLGSLRATATGDRAVLGLSSRPLLPARPPAPSDLAAQQESLDRQLQHHQRLLERAQARLQALQGASLQTRRLRPSLRQAPLQALQGAIGASALLLDLQGAAQQEIHHLQTQIERLKIDLQAARLASRGDLPALDQQPARELLLQLAPGDHLDMLEISYDVEAARWWPAYSARLGAHGEPATLSLEAFVAQDSGESWADVALWLCTADQSSAVDLPRLPSLRLGRRQAPPTRGYRPSPEGLDALFADWSAARQDAAPPPPRPAEPPAPEAAFAAPAWQVLSGAGPPQPIGAAAPAPEVMRAAAPPPKGGVPLPQMARARLESASLFSKKVARDALDDVLIADKDQDESDGFGGEGGGGAPAPAPAALEPAEGWRDLRDLILPDPAAAARPGRLQRRPQEPSVGADAARRLAQRPDPEHCADPLRARGLFDHRYEALGQVEVPANGAPTRVHLRDATAQARQLLRAAPLVEDRVYREVELDNPFDAPLLAGPIDIFVDGALLRTSPFPAVDRGGRVRFGLGVEERVRVARNARVEESSQGLIINTTHVEHHIQIEVASALPFDAQLELLDRVPVTDEKDLEVTLGRQEPRAERYEQVELGRPVRGGLRWSLPLPAGQKRAVQFSYSLKMPAKSEIQGGNRRD